jgi:ElaB/YqjD/DUF883 family membrane-anchored ribosome-binding protein
MQANDSIRELTASLASLKDSSSTSQADAVAKVRDSLQAQVDMMREQLAQAKGAVASLQQVHVVRDPRCLLACMLANMAVLVRKLCVANVT